jgi:hypothetical protein
MWAHLTWSFPSSYSSGRLDDFVQNLIMCLVFGLYFRTKKKVTDASTKNRARIFFQMKLERHNVTDHAKFTESKAHRLGKEYSNCYPE